MKKAFEPKKEFDHKRNMNVVNGFDYISHCHRFMSIMTRMAFDAEKFVNGPQIFIESTEDSIRKVLENMYKEQNIDLLNEKIEIFESYYSWAGLGVISFGAVSESGGEVFLSSSHLDLAWEKMIGESEHAVNLLTCGMISAAFANFYNKPARSYEVKEVESMILGDKRSKFLVKLR